jgi:hypothetical protein
MRNGSLFRSTVRIPDLNTTRRERAFISSIFTLAASTRSFTQIGRVAHGRSEVQVMSSLDIVVRIESLTPLRSELESHCAKASAQCSQVVAEVHA